MKVLSKTLNYLYGLTSRSDPSIEAQEKQDSVLLAKDAFVKVTSKYGAAGDDSQYSLREYLNRRDREMDCSDSKRTHPPLENMGREIDPPSPQGLLDLREIARTARDTGLRNKITQRIFANYLARLLGCSADELWDQHKQGDYYGTYCEVDRHLKQLASWNTFMSKAYWTDECSILNERIDTLRIDDERMLDVLEPHLVNTRKLIKGWHDGFSGMGRATAGLVGTASVTYALMAKTSHLKQQFLEGAYAQKGWKFDVIKKEYLRDGLAPKRFGGPAGYSRFDTHSANHEPASPLGEYYLHVTPLRIASVAAAAGSAYFAVDLMEQCLECLTCRDELTERSIVGGDKAAARWEPRTGLLYKAPEPLFNFRFGDRSGAVPSESTPWTPPPI